MEKYELAVMLPEGTTAAKKKSFIEKFEKLIKVNKGKLIKTDDWGKRELSYEINNENSGYFIIFELELEKEAAKGLAQKLNMDEDIVRYLLISKKGKK